MELREATVSMTIPHHRIYSILFHLRMQGVLHHDQEIHHTILNANGFVVIAYNWLHEVCL